MRTIGITIPILRRNTAAFLTATATPCVAYRTLFGHDLQGESDRAGPRRVPAMSKDGKLVNASIRDRQEYWEEFQNETQKMDDSFSRHRDSYRNNAGVGSGLGGGSYGDDPENPFKASGFGDPDTQSGITGSIHDRENLRVRGEKPPADLPLTDEEVDAHPAAKKLRFVGLIGMVVVLDIMWHVMSDPFNEGERFSRFRQKPDGTDREMMPWLLPKKGGSSSDPRQLVFHKANEEREHFMTYSWRLGGPKEKPW